MSQREKNTFGLFILLAVILCAFFLVNPLFRFSCSRIFMHDFLGADPSVWAPGLFLTDHAIARMVPLLVMFLLWGAVALWVYHDAERRGHSGLLWGLFAFVGNIIGLIVYLIVRASSTSPAAFATAPPVPTTKCPSCAGPIQSSYVACPHCGVNLITKCAQCGKRAEPEWKVCPYCGQTMDGGKTQP